ncbi:MAG: DUF4388 domain-containing protein [Thermoleophilia bacterium]|nr:DUF4388 domain-containing protein [Thermoleophilia bacterium]
MGLTGEIRGFHLPELLQVLGQSKKTGVLTLYGGVAEGTLTLYNGRLVAARAGGASGEEAFYALLQNLEGRFSFVASAPEAPDPHPSVAKRPLEVLLLDATSRGHLDEG